MPVLVLALVAAFTAGGCELILGAAGVGGLGGIGGINGPDDGGGISGPFESFGPEGPAGPTPLASYSKGTATLSLSDGSTILLDRISPGPHVFSEFGSSIRWSNADGWYLSVTGAASADAALGAAYLQLDRVQDHVHWTSDDPTSCRVTIRAANARGMSGAGTCTGLHWVDALGGPGFGGLASPVPGQAPFDVQVSFEATP